MLKPRLPTRAASPPAGPDWLHEIKWEGFRMIARRDGERVRLISRRRIGGADEGGNMTTHRERILDFIARFPGRNDDEIATALEISPRQTVNQICRKLSGKLANFLEKDGHRQEVSKQYKEPMPAVAREGMSEDQVKAAITAMLEANGWRVQVA